MKNLKHVLVIGLLVLSKSLWAQNIKLEASTLEAHQTYLSIEKLMGQTSAEGSQRLNSEGSRRADLCSIKRC